MEEYVPSESVKFTTTRESVFNVDKKEEKFTRIEIEEEEEGVSEPTNALSLPYLPCEYSEEEDEEDCANLASVTACRVTKREDALGI